jgi:hypothetical protein
MEPLNSAIAGASFMVGWFAAWVVIRAIGKWRGWL